jgi:hypothetical protein
MFQPRPVHVPVTGFDLGINTIVVQYTEQSSCRGLVDGILNVAYGGVRDYIMIFSEKHNGFRCRDALSVRPGMDEIKIRIRNTYGVYVGNGLFFSQSSAATRVRPKHSIVGNEPADGGERGMREGVLYKNNRPRTIT